MGYNLEHFSELDRTKKFYINALVNEWNDTIGRLPVMHVRLGLTEICVFAHVLDEPKAEPKAARPKSLMLVHNLPALTLRAEQQEASHCQELLCMVELVRCAA